MADLLLVLQPTGRARYRQWADPSLTAVLDAEIFQPAEGGQETVTGSGGLVPAGSAVGAAGQQVQAGSGGVVPAASIVAAAGQQVHTASGGVAPAASAIACTAQQVHWASGSLMPSPSELLSTGTQTQIMSGDVAPPSGVVSGYCAGGPPPSHSTCCTIRPRL